MNNNDKKIVKARVADLHAKIYEAVFFKKTHGAATLIDALQHFIDHKKFPGDSKECNVKQAHFEKIADTIPDTIWMSDLKLNINYISNRVTELLGYSHEEIIKMTPIDYMKEEDSLKISYILAEALKEAKGAGTEKEIQRKFKTQLIHKDGSNIWVEISATLVCDAAGAPIGIAGVTRDINEEEQIRQETMRAQKLEALGQLAGGMAHNFNNLLGAILAYAEIIMNDKTSSDSIKETSTKISNVVTVARRLVLQILGFARKGKNEIVPISITEGINETIEMFSTTRSDLTINKKIGKDGMYIEGDKSQLQQVFINLLINARDSIDEASMVNQKTSKDIDVNVRLVSLSKNNPFKLSEGDYAVMAIRDYGVGITSVIQEKIFDPYFTTKPSDKGTGLGLASAYGVIKNHGGCITVRSKEMEGATFTCYLPISKKENELNEYKSRKKEPVKKGIGTVLIIDDEIHVTDSCGALIQTLGYDVITINDPTKVKSTFKPGLFDMVFLDLTMPNMSAEEVMNFIISKDMSQKVILQSGYSMDDEAEKVMELGCLEFLYKPIRRVDYARVLSKYVK